MRNRLRRSEARSVIRSVMVKTPEIADYQVHQTPSGIDIAVVTNAQLDRARLGERLRRALAAAGLEQATVGIRTVPALERRSGTGKAPSIRPALIWRRRVAGRDRICPIVHRLVPVSTPPIRCARMADRRLQSIHLSALCLRSPDERGSRD